ncbi:MAG: DUF21 domain-containing protein [Prevotellaceae bacterium]|nr:DUF21 domain-containing protein [Prevotellaceae bacterium]
MGLILLYLTVALSFSFLCSVLEAVLLSTPMSFITLKESEGSRIASLLARYKQDIDRPISAILSLNTIAHTVGAAGVGSAVNQTYGDQWFALASVIMTLLILVVSEIIPKTIGASYWRTLALPSTRIIHVLMWTMSPFVLLSKFITRLIEPKEAQVSVSREEVSAMVTMGTREGVFKKKERRMIQNLLHLESVTAREIMTPSSVVDMAAEEMTVVAFHDSQDMHNYSRIPVYREGEEDFVTGYVLRGEVLEQLSEDHDDMQLRDLARPILSFSENESVSAIWEQLLKKKEHISVIIDEYGCARGIVTMEDVIETMLGYEIVDEKDTVTDMQELAREKWQESQKQSETRTNE